MEPKVKNIDYARCVTHVTFDQVFKVIRVEKFYHLIDSIDSEVRSESYEFNLRTMPLSVALQMACGIVQQVGLVEYEEAN